MRAFNMILLAALVGLWAWFLMAVAPRDTARPVAVEAAGEEMSAASLNNEAVSLDRQGRRADALLYLERAHDFRPHDAVIAANVERQRARVARAGWARALVLATVLGGAWLAFSVVWSFVRYCADAARLHRLRVRGSPWIHVPRDGDRVALPLRFSEPVDGLLRRHPLTIVWSAHGKHMKSQPPVEVRGAACQVHLDRDRLDRLRRYPGDWNGFLYVGKTPVGKAAARVG